ncbi:MAG: ABC-type transport auxiliary lipoprotein family protein [Lysobacteraceae bacterium]
MTTRTPTRRFALLAVLALSLTAGGCVLTRQSNPIQVFAPVIQVQAEEDWPEVDWQLLVVRPNADQMHDSQRILVRPVANRLQVYRGASWSDTLPDMLHSILLRAFEDSGRIDSVTRQSTNIRSRFALTLDIRSFEAVYDEPGLAPAADVHIHAKLIHSPTTRVIASRTFRHWQRSGGTDTDSVVDAFSEATREFVSELVGWTLVEGENAGPRLAAWREQRMAERAEERRSRGAPEEREDGPGED